MGGDDVGSPFEQEAGHRGHDPGLVGAGDQQARRVAGVVLLGGSARRIAPSPRSWPRSRSGYFVVVDEVPVVFGVLVAVGVAAVCLPVGFFLTAASWVRKRAR